MGDDGNIFTFSPATVRAITDAQRKADAVSIGPAPVAITYAQLMQAIKRIERIIGSIEMYVRAGDDNIMDKLDELTDELEQLRELA